jgi:hypothetical protein
MNMSVAEKDREFQEIKKAAEAQNWTVKRTSRGHFQFKAPDGKATIVAGGTYKDPHAIKNLVARLRRHGFTQR